MKPIEALEKVRSKFHISVNVFVGVLLGIFVLVLGIGAFTQTGWFKNWLRDTIVEQVNSSINGRISIGEIGGTLFTSLYIKDFALLGIENDTIIRFSSLGLKYSPHALLRKTILLRTVYLDKAAIRLIKDSAGLYNIEKLVPESEEDTTSSEFPLKLDLRNISIEGLDFTIADYDKAGNELSYPSMDLSDFRIKNLNVNISAFADIKKNLYSLTLNQLDFSSNLTYFNLNNLEGSVSLDRDVIKIQDLTLNSNLSDLKLNASMKGFNPFDDFSLEKLSSASVKVELIADRFNFDDLTSFLSSTDMLKGEVNGVIKGEGTLNDLSVDQIDLKYRNSNLNINGYLQRITDFDKFYIKALVKNSRIFAKDVSALLPGIGIPAIEGFEDVSIDSITYDGHPLNFLTTFDLKTPSGLVAGSTMFNFMPAVTEYELNANIAGLNVTKLTKYPIEFNGKIDVKGKGFSPETAQIYADVTGEDILIGRKRFRGLRLNTSLSSNIFVAELFADAYGPDSLFFSGELNLQDPNLPFYSFRFDATSFNLNGLIPDTVLYTNLNLSLEGEGEHLDPEKLNAYLKLILNRSTLYDKPITDTRANLSVRSGDAGNKNIKLISNIADIEVNGKFSYVDLIEKIVNEQSNIVEFVDSVVARYFPGNLPVGEKVKAEFRKPEKMEKVSHNISDLRFSIKVKDLSPIQSFTANTDFSLDGQITGRVRDDSTMFYLNLELAFDFFSASNKGFLLFGDKSSLSVNYTHDKLDGNLNNFNAGFNLDVGLLHLNGNDIIDSYAKFNLDKGVISIDTKGTFGNIVSGELKARIDATLPFITAEIERVIGVYKGYSLVNKNKIDLSYRDKKLIIKNCELVRGNSSLKIDGYISEKGRQELNISASNFKGYDISYNILGLPASDIVDYDFNAIGKIDGSFDAPLISLLIFVDSLSYRETNFGVLKGFINYSAEKILTDLRFIEKRDNFDSAKFNLYGILPINLSLTDVKERFPENKPVNIKIKSNDFDLQSLVNAVPFVRNLKGFLTSNIEISGTYKELKRDGSLELRDAFFTLEQNLLDYNANVKLLLSNDAIEINELSISNAGAVKNKGNMVGGGRILFQEDGKTSVEMKMHGNLTVLAPESRSAIPEMYGDLFLETVGDIVFTSEEGNSMLLLPLRVIEANLTFPPTQSAYSGSSSNYIYKYPVTEVVKTQRELDIEKLLNRESKKVADSATVVKETGSNFDVVVNVQIRDEAAIDFIFSEETNQKLTAFLSGEVNFSRVKGIQSLQGELKLLENSTLEFIKTFTASGSIRFESDITNPNLDILAEYKDFYTPADSLGISKETEVAVRMRLKGKLNELYKNFASLEDNIQVFYGTANIRNDKPSSEYDKADAVWFILTSKFKKDLTSEQKTTTVGTVTGMGTSVAGSLLGSLIKNYLGEYVSSVEIRGLGSTTKFNLSGRWKKLRYTVGGSTNVLQDFSSANIRIEYPIIENFIFRIERKESVTNADYPSEMINEVAIKYRFEF